MLLVMNEKLQEILQDISDVYKSLPVNDNDSYKESHRQARKKLNKISNDVRKLHVALDYAYSLLPDGEYDDRILYVKKYVLIKQN